MKLNVFGEGGERPEWQLHGLCRHYPTKLFFPDKGPGLQRSINQAKRICEACPVAAPCLEFAMAHNDGGVWSGTTQRERERIRRQRNRKRAA